MCYKEGTLQAYLDGAYEGDIQELVHHLAVCSHCRQTYDRLKFQELRIAELLDAQFLAPCAEAFPKPSYPKIVQPHFIRRLQNMKSTTKKWIATAACIGIAASVFTFQPAMAESFLKMFRVNQIESVAISDKNLEEMQSVLSSGEGKFKMEDLISVEAKHRGEIVTLDRPDVKTLSEKIPELQVFGQDQLKIACASKMPASDITLVLSVPKINDVLASIGETVQLPAALDKKPVVLHFKDTYSLEMSSSKADSEVYARLAQSTFPDIEIPEQVDQNAFIKSLYAMNFIPSELKKQFMSINNPGSVIPIPYNPDSQSKEVVSANGKDVMIIKDKKGDSMEMYFMAGGKFCYLHTNAAKEQALNWIKELK